MGVCIDFEDSKGKMVDGDEVATNSGWASFGEWVETLPQKSYGRVIELWEEGATLHVGELTSQLRKAIESKKPSKNVRIVAENIVFLTEKFSTAVAAYVEDES